MAEQRRKGPGRKGRPADRGGKTRRSGGRPARGARTRRGGSHGPRTVIPSSRWRPMRRVAGVPWEEQHHGEPRRVRVESE